MENIYKIIWTDFALDELADTFEYLETFFGEKELKFLANEIEKVISIIAKNPLAFQISIKKSVHKIVIAKYNTMYYKIVGETVEIVSFFSNRQHPDKANY
ncbi:type II toxin-antitoxin system RelE/ParE family toxin [Frigoriflavimonas asaccharolytica]|uniref:Plasmid stabilization system protein ParE n=1 Tax=Frigoriflavimonas asaccharolytica TaxID=2735899 RepID=A0A8J8G9W7_9FLAO|nr:type II toxin-antitoxin system RelE/ParE family toxin [Frigoriflavimonas asaccharolytica]NRS93971.1 plasmid stabilization system protein ParE [Frigoriflavimonas asaccharolytica]